MDLLSFNIRKKDSEQAVCGRIGISMSTYNLMQFNAAITYLNALFGEGIPATRKLERTPVFWSWWRIRYVYNNERFLSTGSHSRDEFYQLQTSVNTFPPKCIYSLSQHRLKVFKNHLNQ